MSFLSIIKTFVLASRDHTDRFRFYDTNVRCFGSDHPIPAELCHYPVPEDKPIQDDAAANVTAKMYVPDSNGTEPIVLDSLEIDVFDGDPTNPSYYDPVPWKPPKVAANGVVSDMN